MALHLDIHPANPQPRLLKQAAQWLNDGGLVAVPTDSSYAVVARLDDKNAADGLRRLRGLDDRHHLTLLCRDLAEIGHFARVDNRQYRLLKAATPGPWTFILEATKEVPRRVSHPSRKTIGIRVPEKQPRHEQARRHAQDRDRNGQAPWDRPAHLPHGGRTAFPPHGSDNITDRREQSYGNGNQDQAAYCIRLPFRRLIDGGHIIQSRERQPCVPGPCGTVEPQIVGILSGSSCLYDRVIQRFRIRFRPRLFGHRVLG